jgi:hypothetical protein
LNDLIVNIIEEQIILGLTGKINVLSSETKQFLGSIYLIEGRLANVKYLEIEGAKAFFNLCTSDDDGITKLEFIIEPELIDSREKKIARPFSILKRKLYEIAEKQKESKQNKPPGSLKLLVLPEFITSTEAVNSIEYSLMCTMSDYNLVSDIYKKSPLLDFEITNALVSLRKKNAIKVIEHK